MVGSEYKILFSMSQNYWGWNFLKSTDLAYILKNLTSYHPSPIKSDQLTAKSERNPSSHTKEQRCWCSMISTTDAEYQSTE